MSFTAFSPLFDMVIYPAICGIVVVVMVIDILPAGEEMIFELLGFTTNEIGSQDKKEKQ